MNQTKYDIFISYRRYSGSQYARILKLMLDEKGYSVFYDYDCIKCDSNFVEQLEDAVCNSKIYMIILTQGIFCSEYTTKGILKANKLNKTIIPVVCDNCSFTNILESWPESKEAYDIIHNIPYSEIDFGETFKSCFDYMEKNRIRKYVKPSLFRRLLCKIKNSLTTSSLIK